MGIDTWWNAFLGRPRKDQLNMFDDIKMKRGRLYGLMVDAEDVSPEGSGYGEQHWGLECFGDGLISEKPMCEIIINAANHAIDPPRSDYPGGLLYGKTERNFSWMGARPLEEPHARSI
jgi:hypothetical protein